MKTLNDTLGRPLHDLRISVLDQCNLRCTYCMPAKIFGPEYAFLKREQLLSFEEIARLARLSAQIGVRKIRLTGGEPLLRRNLANLIRMLTPIPEITDLALTTNGILLPHLAETLVSAGLKRVTVSLDALDDAVFQAMNGRGVPVDKVLAGIDAAASAGIRVKINMVVQRGVNDEQIQPMARYFKDRGHILRFIEFMDVGNHNGWKMEGVYSSRRIVEDLGRIFEIEPLDPNYRGEVARRYRYVDCGIEFGLISSVTQPFCTHCTRARLSADGLLYTCLFANQGWDFKEMLRSGESDKEILMTLTEIWTARTDRYSELRSDILRRHLHPLKVEMSYIGG